MTLRVISLENAFELIVRLVSSKKRPIRKRVLYMCFPLYKIILCDFINPISDRKAELVRNGAIVLKRGPLKQEQKPLYKVEDFGLEKTVLRKYISKKSLEVVEMVGILAIPSFFDVHFHWVQDDVRLMPKDFLLEWLSKYTWPHEAKFKKVEFSKKKAKTFCQELLRVGTLGGACYGSIHDHTVDHALESFIGDFVVGNVLMTMNSPQFLIQSQENALKSVLGKAQKYGKEYAVTPRFAPTTHPEVMKKTASMARRYKCFIQSHLSENTGEIEYVLYLYKNIKKFMDVKSYTEIYDRCGVLGPKTIMGHGIYLNNKELSILKRTDTCIAHCPTSNAPVKDLGLGSGLFNFKKIERAGIRWALASDIGGGPFLSMFDVMRSFVKQNLKKSISEATYTKALYRSTQAGAQVLGLGKTHGNFLKGKQANMIFLESPIKRKGETAETLLKKIVEQKLNKRDEYSDLVLRTIYQGHEVYSVF